MIAATRERLCSLEELVAADPECKAIVQRAVEADPADLAIVPPGAVQRERVLVIRGIIHDFERVTSMSELLRLL